MIEGGFPGPRINHTGKRGTDENGKTIRPNCRPRLIQIDDQQPLFGIFATEDIPAHTTLYYDYGSCANCFRYLPLVL